MWNGFRRWVVLFFSRPVRLADGVAFVRRLRPGPKPAPSDEDSNAPPRPALVKKSLGETDQDRWRDLDPAVQVSEESLDTLPVELQEELTRAIGERKT
jgi:hypothetical protein